MIFGLSADDKKKFYEANPEATIAMCLVAAVLLVSVILFINVRTQIYKKQKKQNIQYAAVANSGTDAWNTDI